MRPDPACCRHPPNPRSSQLRARSGAGALPTRQPARSCVHLRRLLPLSTMAVTVVTGADHDVTVMIDGLRIDAFEVDRPGLSMGAQGAVASWTRRAPSRRV